ncbi:hypothetical protein B296_00059221 [Ensete ventricosum]|uniref:Uncharacterized protein n=1 Tax=Ensete ventricosum TaxID=4639 RepID=A0A426XIP5_ENSVE|nr:hypothetical protein B296_00059221 [Ensete ventricosum]
MLMIKVSFSDEESSTPDESRFRFDGDGESELEKGELSCEMDSVLMRGSERVARIPVNVDSFGAVGDGVADDTQVQLQHPVCNTDGYRSYRVVHTGLPVDRNADRPLPGGTTNWGLTVDFDYRRSISGGINRGRKKKREKLESALLSRSLRMRDPSPAGDFFSPRKEKKCLLARGEGTR